MEVAGRVNVHVMFRYLVINCLALYKVGMTTIDGNIRLVTAPDGTLLRIGHWPSAPGARRAVLCHGRIEFLEKHDEVICELNSRGFDVWSMDWRGQGLSGRTTDNPKKGHISDFQSYIEDLQWFLGLIGDNKDAETILIGHSMGGHVVLRALLSGLVKVDRAIVTAPMIDLPMNKVVSAAVAVLCSAACMAGLGTRYAIGFGDSDPARGTFDGNPLTRDRDRFAAIHSATAATPGAEMGGPTFGWLNAALNSIGVLRTLSSSTPAQCPILLCTALEDVVVSVEAQHAFSEAQPSCTQIRFENAAHEILQETDAIRDRFWKSFDRFIAPP